MCSKKVRKSYVKGRMFSRRKMGGLGKEESAERKWGVRDGGGDRSKVHLAERNKCAFSRLTFVPSSLWRRLVLDRTKEDETDGLCEENEVQQENGDLWRIQRSSIYLNSRLLRIDIVTIGLGGGSGWVVSAEVFTIWMNYGFTNWNTSGEKWD